MADSTDSLIIRTVLKQLADPEGVARPDSDLLRQVALDMFEGRSTPAQVGAFLAALHTRGETLDDLVAFAEVMREKALGLQPPPGSDVVDTCGTGGDHSGTFNISTAAALVVAGAGVPVAKHGNRAASSACGSADVLEALGVRIDAPIETMQACLAEAGICFMFAQGHHPAMKHVGPVRRELGIPTIFNMLGPLTNPAGARRQLVGVGTELAFDLYPAALERLGSVHALVVRGQGGMDEITPYGTTRCREWVNGAKREYTITPESMGRQTFAPADLKAGPDPAANAAILRAVLAGEERGAKREAVVLNAGATLLVSGRAASLVAGIARAEAAIDQGAATRALNRFIARSQGE